MANASTALVKKLEQLASELRQDGQAGYADWVEALAFEAEMPTAVVKNNWTFPNYKVSANVDGKRCRPVGWDLSQEWIDVVPLDKHEEPAGPVERVHVFLFGGHSSLSKLDAVQRRRAGKNHRGVFPPGYQP